MLLQDIENDPIIKDQMANFACLLVFAFGNFLAPFLVAAHTVNNLDLGDEQGLEMRVMKVIKNLLFCDQIQKVFRPKRNKKR